MEKEFSASLDQLKVSNNIELELCRTHECPVHVKLHATV